MGLFTSKEQKEQQQRQKEYEKQAQEEAKITAKLAERNLEDIDDEYRSACVQIINSLVGTGMMELGAAMKISKTEDNLKITYLHAIMDQNWIMIRQLDRITKALENR